MKQKNSMLILSGTDVFAIFAFMTFSTSLSNQIFSFNNSNTAQATSGMTPDSEYYVVASLLSSTISVMDMDAGDTNLEIIGRISLTTNDGMTTDTPFAVAVTGNAGQGGKGVLAIPNVYNGWVQNLPESWLEQLTIPQRDPI